ncbi:urea ABC transporter permease [Leptolyngbya sp. NK1-12]|uniref:Urea ABC transporter permease n=1 Tax=Leptolyngbya sp. NK1-12 TaxID=2547451 RepID=A0AA96WEZ6_9CYAN|nr:hypothetical protein [Leptolyngbya sp. NK1-12]WNZ24143.1 urea ABC transporter permease [Leptolyngbya sp. NK1-12]
MTIIENTSIKNKASSILCRIRRIRWNAENLAALIFFVALLLLPLFISEYQILNFIYFNAFIFLSLSLCLIWGFGGILSFGQTAFFGIGGYLYGILTLNVTQPSFTFAAAAIAILTGGIIAGILGYFMFYGGVNDHFVSLLMLAFTLVLETFMAQTAGSEWRVGKAALGGFNGMNAIPPLAIGKFALTGASLFYLVLLLLMSVYLFLRWLLQSRFGYGLMALRENRVRTETLGYNVRLMQCQIFALGGCLAALSGVLYVVWGGYITPSSMGLDNAALPVILVAAGGRKNLTASMIASLIILWFSQTLAIHGDQYALLILGLLLTLATLFGPQGFMASLFQWADHLLFSSKSAS